ncbi:MAG TPA: AAA family ATPase [Pirellulaceae bacterium]|nr:AAA family ATPase [Pirellulaceae bacterium]HMO91470.1 AAA family ATPase [Pirellulaceae bacterium]HMP69453.1 AAA family ATPase [Pirellulaceae bacterium]
MNLNAQPEKRSSEIEQMLDRIGLLMGGSNRQAKSNAVASDLEITDFVPLAPDSLESASLNSSNIQDIILKYLLATGEASGREVSKQLRLPFSLITPLITALKSEQLVGYVGQASLSDYICRLTEVGIDRARRLSRICTYFGSAPVSLAQYISSVKRQTIEGEYPTPDKLKSAFADLLINHKLFRKLGPAVSSGRGMFLYGYPGNGKTSIAERVARSFGPYIWVPRAITVDGEIIRIFDPMVHQEAPLETNGGLMKESDIDERWVRIKRPTIVVGGELTMDQLEITFNKDTGVSEAPVQLKSNCGVLVIDDFGRQKMRVDELLNRWIVPLEKRYDFLNLSSGKKFQVPFDQLVIFSTNLEPKDLVDDAFLRRIPYKIEVENPSRAEFTKLFEIMCNLYQVPYSQDAVEYLIETHYRPVDRPFRNCQPRDLLLQIINYCRYNQFPVRMTKESIDFAVDNYFSIM